MNNRYIKIFITFLFIMLVGFFIGMPYLNNSNLQTEIDNFISRSNSKKIVELNLNDLNKLPISVRKYLNKSIKTKTNPPKYCKYKIEGKIKENNSEWVNIVSENYYSLVAPEFLKIIIAEKSFFNETVTIHKYINNQALLNKKLLSAITIENLSGNKLNKSYLVLYLMESVFAPSVLLPNRNVHWSSQNRGTAEAEIWDDNLKGTASFYFNKKNEVIKVVTATRFRKGKIDFTKEKFTLHLANYKDVGNYYIPTYFEYEWNLPDGNSTVGRFQIKEIKYE